MAASLIVKEAILRQNDILIHATASALENGLGLFAQDMPIMLTRAPANEIAFSTEPSQKSFFDQSTAPLLTEEIHNAGEASFGTKTYLNKLPEWALQNGQTLQVQLGKPDQPRLIKINQSVKIKSDDQEYFFEAYVATHRCEATLSICFEIGNSEKIEKIDIPMDPAYSGGTAVPSYQHVRVPVPKADGDVWVFLQIEYLTYLADGTNQSPFIFLANPRVFAKHSSRKNVEPLYKSIGSVEADTWYHAKVPLFRTEKDTPIQLVIGKTRTELFSPIRNTVTLVEDYGHSFVLKARNPESFLLFVDGQPTQEIKVAEDPTLIHLPASCLRGEIIDLTIRDMSGSQVFLSLAVLAPRLLTPHDVIVRETRRPFPTDLTSQTNHRYRSLRAHMENPIKGMDPAALATAFAALDCSYETVKLKPIAFPVIDQPRISVIIPAHNKAEVTYYGLCALLAAHNRASFEVIVVDDASTDETAQLEEIVSGITVVRNTEPQRFIRACNAGVAAARGEYVVLLNNDTEPTSGWLDALLDAFDRFDRVGLVGSKLLYPDGKLQDAGGIIWGNGNPWNYGNRANPWEPRFCYARQADYLSGAAMMTTRKIWDEVGGLSNYLEPMYFEDTDFAFKVREAGYTTWFVPGSVVYHFEGMTSGTDISSGFKKYQEINRPKFKRRWVRDYARFGTEGQTPDLEKDRGIIGRVLFIDYTTPHEDRDAGSYAARREIELVQSLGYKVTFLPQNLAHFGALTEDLQNSGVEVIVAPFYLSLPEFLEKRAAEFDAVYITRYYVAQDTISHIRRHAPKAKIMLNNADLHFLRELRAALSENDPSRLAAMRRVRDEELEMMRAADLVLSYNEVEHAVITSHTDGQAKVMTCPWVVDIPDHVPPLKSRKGLSFLGGFGHYPNAEGVRWFIAEVMPRLEKVGAHLSIYGSQMGKDIKALASSSIDPVGFVEEVAEAYDRHRVFVAPLLSGAGIKGKVLGALAHGIPCVLSPVAAEGIGLRHGHDCLIAETPQAWAEAITRLMQDDALWEAMSQAARQYTAERFSFAAGRAKMKAAFEAVDLFGAE
jgi:O-antigen biosynthesis protein